MDNFVEFPACDNCGPNGCKCKPQGEYMGSDLEGVYELPFFSADFISSLPFYLLISLISAAVIFLNFLLPD